MMSYIDLNWDFSQFDRDNSARHHTAGYAKIANILADDLRRRPGRRRRRPRTTTLNMAPDGVRAHTTTRARSASRGRPTGSSPREPTLAGKPAAVVEPSTFTVVGPVKPGNGPGRASAKARGARDLDDRANVKRMFSK